MAAKGPASSGTKAGGKTPAAGSSSTRKDAKGKASAPSRKLRVICLHGLRTSGKIMEKQVELAEWGQFVDDLVEFVYIDAPYPATGKSDVEKKFDPPYFEWYQANQDYTEIYGLEKSIDHITSFIKSRGPFDGLMGFSQRYISHPQSMDMRGRMPSIRLEETENDWSNIGWSFGGSTGKGCKSKALILRPAYFDSITTSSLHLIGEKDFMKEGGELLVQAFTEPTVINHAHGHLIPRLGEEEAKTCRAFFQRFFELKYPNPKGTQNSPYRLPREGS